MGPRESAADAAGRDAQNRAGLASGGDALRGSATQQSGAAHESEAQPRPENQAAADRLAKLSVCQPSTTAAP